MVRPALRSRSLRRVKRKVPGGRTVLQFKDKKPKVGSCPVTGQKLQGIARVAAPKLKKTSKSQKRPSRPFGGHLSSQAMRSVIKQRTRQ